MVYRSRIIHYEFHFNAFPETFRNARFLRRNMTKAEKILWKELRSRNLCGFKFRRQHPVGHYIVDFFCVEARLVVEVDGPVHRETEVMERDVNRNAELKRLGLTVIRFTNDMVVNDIENVIYTIASELEKKSSNGG